MSQIKLFTSNSCTKCKILKQVLVEEEIDFLELNIDLDEDAKQILIEKGLLALPVIELDAKFHSGLQTIKTIVLGE